MKLTTLVKALVVLPATVVFGQAPDLRTFRLRPDEENPEVGKLGFLSNGMGWRIGAPANDFRGYIDPVKRTLNGTGTGIMFLRPTDGTPKYFVQVGDPLSGSDAQFTTYAPWSIITNTKFNNGKAVTRDWLDGSWIACSFGPNQDQYQLYSGPEGGSARCSGIFMLEVVYDRTEEPVPTSNPLPFPTLDDENAPLTPRPAPTLAFSYNETMFNTSFPTSTSKWGSGNEDEEATGTETPTDTGASASDTSKPNGAEKLLVGIEFVYAYMIGMALSAII